MAEALPFSTALLAGAVAGTTVDMSLFPLDTLKTRLQSSKGFFASGGFRGMYRGVGSAFLGSAPGASLFFVTYEAVKSRLTPVLVTSFLSQSASGSSRRAEAVSHMVAASLGEIAACSVRVPTEVIKQRAQAGLHGGSSLSTLKAILLPQANLLPNSCRSPFSRAISLWQALYRGWGITIMREVPFTVIQFPLWEVLKQYVAQRRRTPGHTDHHTNRDDHGHGSTVWESSLCGSVAGAVASALTTPLDVVKTRVMLAQQRRSIADVVRETWREGGARVFFSGMGPRVTWISIGGAIFLGSYQAVVNVMADI